MEVNLKKRPVCDFCTLKTGEAFVLDDVVFLKTSISSDDDRYHTNSVTLKDGLLSRIVPGTLVELLNLDVKEK